MRILLFVENMKHSELTQFLVSIDGSIEVIEFEGGINDSELYLRYEIVCGADWSVVSGLSGAVSQLAAPGRDARRVVFNLPLQVTLSSTNVSGWPQLIVSVYGVTSRHTETVLGYGRAHLPTCPALRELVVPLFRPRPLTRLGAWLAWLTGRAPEIADPATLAKPHVQSLMRTESYGKIKATVSMVSKDLHKLGYDNLPASG